MLCTYPFAHGKSGYSVIPGGRMKNRLQKILEREHQGKDNAIVSRALEERLQSCSVGNSKTLQQAKEI